MTGSLMAHEMDEGARLVRIDDLRSCFATAFNAVTFGLRTGKD
jgi:hypothetical protein